MFLVKNIMEGLEDDRNDNPFIEPDPITGKYDMEEIQRKAVIPLHIYQTWHTNDLPPKMRECVNRLKAANPEFEYHLYDENDCREFIRTNFESDVIDAFDSLIPLSYKSDLWRYCILYKNGGIYLDIKFEPVNGFKFISCVNKEHFSMERPYADENIKLEDELKIINNENYYENIYNKIDTNLWKNKKIGILSGMIIVKPNNPILFECIEQIIKNVKNKYYGHNPLYPTGPGLLGEKYFKDKKTDPKNLHFYYSINGKHFLTKKMRVMKMYDEYRDEQKIYGKNSNYYSLWAEKKNYK